MEVPTVWVGDYWRGYRVEYSTNESFDTNVIALPDVSATTDSISISNLAANTTYYVRVTSVAIGAYCDSDPSETHNATSKCHQHNDIRLNGGYGL